MLLDGAVLAASAVNLQIVPMANAHRPIRDGIVATVVGGVILAVLIAAKDLAIPVVSGIGLAVAAFLSAKLSISVFWFGCALLGAVAIGRVAGLRGSSRDRAIKVPTGLTAMAPLPPNDQSQERRLAREAPSQIAGQSVDQHPEREWLRENPKKICEHYYAAPPLSREAVAREAFLGRWVSWCGRIRSIKPYRDSIHLVIRIPEDAKATDDVPAVMVDFPLSASAALSRFREGDIIAFAARVAKVSQYDVSLDTAEILDVPIR